MRKIVNIILCLCIMVATFDIVDVHDITLNGKPLFHSDVMPQNQGPDSLDSNKVNVVNIMVFNVFPENSTSIKVSYRVFDRTSFTDDPEYNNYINNLYRPPIA